jgi:hypothetical protein
VEILETGVYMEILVAQDYKERLVQMVIQGHLEIQEHVEIQVKRAREVLLVRLGKMVGMEPLVPRVERVKRVKREKWE